MNIKQFWMKFKFDRLTKQIEKLKKQHNFEIVNVIYLLWFLFNNLSSVIFGTYNFLIFLGTSINVFWIKSIYMMKK